MKRTQFLSTLAIGLVALHTLPAQAGTIKLGQPSYGGNGCPAGSASASISPDGKSLSILFDKYVVEAGGDHRRVSRKSCNLSIPVDVPNGLSVSLISADYRGFVDAPKGTEARLDTEYFFGGARGPRFSHVFRGPHSSPYTKSHQLVATANTWSGCGQDVNLRVNSGTTVKSHAGNAALATVDSADFKAGMVYHLRYRSCQAPQPTNHANNNTNNHNNANNNHRPNNNHANHNNQRPNNNGRNNSNQPGGVTDYYYPAGHNNGYRAPNRHRNRTHNNRPRPRWEHWDRR